MRYSRSSSAEGGAGQAFPAVTLEFLGRVNSVIMKILFLVVFILSRQSRPKIIVFFYPQHPDVSNGGREPIVFGRQSLNDRHATNCINSVVAKICAALFPLKSTSRQIVPDVDVCISP